MTAPNAYRAKTLSFAASAKTGLTSLRVSASGQTTDLVADAVDSVMAVFVDALACDVEGSVTDISAVNTIKPGDVGSLVVTFEKRAEGRAGAGSGTLTGTFANAVCVSNDADAGTTGIGSGSIKWRCSAPAGGGAVVWS